MGIKVMCHHCAVEGQHQNASPWPQSSGTMSERGPQDLHHCFNGAAVVNVTSKVIDHVNDGWECTFCRFLFFCHLWKSVESGLGMCE